MLLKNLLPQYFNSNLKISSIEIDSRLVTKGSIFFALTGINNNGTQFIKSAFQNGAIAIICDADSTLVIPQNSNNIIKVKNIHQLLIKTLQKFYYPLPKNILAITGTNGKSSVVYFIQQMQKILGKNSASIGTIGITTSSPEIQNHLTKFNLTTPDIISLYKNLSILKQHDVDDIAIEASSIGLDQNRMSGLEISLGAFTNFSQDHLDYHQTMTKYFNCKMILFTQILKQNSIAVLNSDINEFKKIKDITLTKNLQIFTYSPQNKSISCLTNHNPSLGQTIKFINQKLTNFSSTIDFHNANILCALTCVLGYYQPKPKQTTLLINNLNTIQPAQGRMQLVANLKNNATIFIDYAHTPEALQNLLQSAQKIPHNDLYILFGCGGDRDTSKRPQMGKIANDLADKIIITDDNPRTENASKIRKQILSTCNPSKTTEIDNRKNAIEQTIAMLKDNDILIIAGKGHEKYQIIGQQKFPFDENKIINNFIAKKQ